jgi:hypothetical protein
LADLELYIAGLAHTGREQAARVGIVANVSPRRQVS